MFADMDSLYDGERPDDEKWQEFFSIVGGAIAISPAAYYESVEVCKTRTHELRLREGFVRKCLEQARARRVSVFLKAEEEYRIDSICQYRAMSDLFSRESRIPGTVCQDSLVTSGVSHDCRYVMVSYTRGFGAETSSSVSGLYVSQALSRLMAVHGSGFAVDVESGLQNFDDAASLRLDPLKLQPLILASGQWGERSMQLLKSDLERFQQGLSGRFNDESLIRDFGNWVRKIRIDRTEIPRSTEYAEWIDRFANSNLKKRKASENVVRKSVVRTPAIAEFVSLFSSCKKELQRARSDDSIEKGDEFTLVSTGDVFTANERLPSGENGEIFGTSIPAMLIKTAFSRSEFCLELAALTALKGLGGRIPVLYEVDDAVGRMMVMRRVGKTDWPLNNDPVRPSNEHLAQVIEIVRDLHEAGLVHGDLHEGNIRMDAEHVYLIDFGMVRPIYTRGADSLKTRRTDMMRLTEFVITTSAPGGLEMLADMDVLGDDDRPDYEKWIAHFRSSL